MVVVIMSSKRFYPADHSLLLFAQFLDNYCLRQLTDQCRDFADLCFGGAEVVQYRDEVKLIAHLMYYCSCLLSIHATLGQQFCGLSLFRTLPSSNSSAGERITKPTDKFGMLNTYLSTALVYSVLPYVYAKKTVIWGKLCDVCDLLFSSEPDAYDISDRRTPSRDSAASPSDTDSLQLQHTVNNNHKPSYLSLMVNAVYRSITSISNEVDVRLERMFNYLIELHFLIFLYNSR